MTADILLVTSDHDGLVVIRGEQAEIIDHTSTTGLWVTEEAIIRTIQRDDKSGVVVYRTDKSCHLYWHPQIQGITDVLEFRDRIYVLSTSNNKVYSLTKEGKIENEYDFSAQGHILHLSGMAVWENKVVLSAFGAFSEPLGYKGNTQQNGFVFELESGLKLWEHLSQPHSPNEDSLGRYVCDSENNSVLVSRDGKQHTIQLFGYTRGLAVGDRYIYVSQSNSQNGQGASSGKICVIDKESLELVRQIELPFDEVHEIRIINETLLAKFDLRSPLTQWDQPDEQSVILKQKVDQLQKLNDIQLLALTQVDNELKRLQETKAWKLMLLFRRINQQLMKGNTKDRRKFFKYIRNKVFRKRISKELEMSQFNPVTPIKFYAVNETETDSSSYSSCGKRAGALPKHVDAVEYPTSDGYDIFRFPVISWNFRWQRPQQISVEFSKEGHRIFYVSLETIELSTETASYEEVAQKVSIREIQRNVWNVTLCSHQRLNPYNDVIDHPLDLKYLNWSIQSVKERMHIGQSVSIIDLPFWAPLVSGIESTKVIYDCMDDHAGFENNSQDMLACEHQLIRSADLLIATSQRLYDKIKKENSRIELIRNAGEYQHFSVEPAKLAAEIVNAKGPVIGYYGAIAEWFDIKLIEYLAERNRDWTFILVGHVSNCDTTKAESLPNVIFTGEKPYDELPSYLYGFDVCLIPFLVNNLTLATNPVKVYEYLAAGKPVVSTKLPEVELIPEIVLTASTHAEFESCVKQSLKEKSEELARSRKDFASKNTWHDRYLALKNAIDRAFFPKVSVVIVTYNNWSYTKSCLESLIYNSDYPNLEIIVVDNASHDETRVELARIRKSNIKVILSPQNTGFAGGNNIGLQAASGDYLILLNNDTIVPKGWIERLLKPLRSNSELGMVGPVSNSVGNDQTLDYFVGDPFNGPDETWLDLFYRLYKGKVRMTEMLGFYCVAIRREVYEQVGGLDTAYGIGMFEDDDYCERVRRQGYKLAIVEDAFVYHHGSASFKKLEDKRYRAMFEKNKMVFERKWNKAWKMPNPPLSLFFDAMDTETVLERLGTITSPKLLVLSHPSAAQRVETLIHEMSEADDLPFTLIQTDTFLGHPVIGTRKAGPAVYLTNRVDLFEGARFEAILYCGNCELPVTFSSDLIMVDQTLDWDKLQLKQAAVPVQNGAQILALIKQATQQVSI